MKSYDAESLMLAILIVNPSWTSVFHRILWAYLSVARLIHELWSFVEHWLCHWLVSYSRMMCAVHFWHDSVDSSTMNCGVSGLVSLYLFDSVWDLMKPVAIDEICVVCVRNGLRGACKIFIIYLIVSILLIGKHRSVAIGQVGSIGRWWQWATMYTSIDVHGASLNSNTV